MTEERLNELAAQPRCICGSDGICVNCGGTGGSAFTELIAEVRRLSAEVKRLEEEAQDLAWERDERDV